MTKENNSKRLYSLDALRGADMLMISGGGAFLHLMYNKTNYDWLNNFAFQMEHSGWLEPLTFYDFIFPLFLFISGVSLAFSLSGHLSKGTSKTELYKKMFKRMIILILLGFIYKNSPINIYDPAHLRYSSVLGRIGMATFFTTFLYLNYSWQKRLLWIAGILFTYYTAMLLIPVPGFGAGNFSIEGNFAGWIDRMVMPGRLINGVFDENAFATSFTAFTLTIFGAWAGDILKNVKTSSSNKTNSLIIIGAVLIGLSLIWNLHFPISKKMWTSSFILITAGSSFIALAAFYWIIDVRKYVKRSLFFRVIGLNSLVIYLGYHFIDFRYTSHKLFSGLYNFVGDEWVKVIDTFGGIILVWLLLYFLYRKKWFLKV